MSNKKRNKTEYFHFLFWVIGGQKLLSINAVCKSSRWIHPVCKGEIDHTTTPLIVFALKKIYFHINISITKWKENIFKIKHWNLKIEKYTKYEKGSFYHLLSITHYPPSTLIVPLLKPLLIKAISLLTALISFYF